MESPPTVGAAATAAKAAAAATATANAATVLATDDTRPHSARDHLLALRDWLWRRPVVFRQAARLPLIRRLARRRARSLFDLVGGFVYSQVTLAAVRLDLCGALANGPLSTAALARRLDLSEPATRRLLDATDALGLTMPRSRGRHGLDELGLALANSPGLATLIEHHTLLYDDLRDPVALLRGEVPETALGRYWAYVRQDSPADVAPDSVADYSALMANSQDLLADDILSAWPPAIGAGRWLDLGGGEGVFAAAVARRARRARVTVFDLPAVAARARARLDAAGLAHRVEAVGGDFLRDSLPAHQDVVSLVRVIHDHDDDAALAILHAARAALAPGGRLLLAEPMAGTPGAEPIGAAYFGFYLLAMGSGRARSQGELRALLERAGFRDIRMPGTAQPLLVRLMVARPAQPTDR